MPRKGPAPRRELMPDPIYRSVLVTQLVNKVLQRGKRSMAERIVYDALEHVEEKTGAEPDRHRSSGPSTTSSRSSRSRAAGSVAPPTRSPSRSGPAGPTPSPSAGWSATARQRREKTMAERLANELLDASNGIGASVKRREDMHKMAESNKAFAHYRW